MACKDAKSDIKNVKTLNVATLLTLYIVHIYIIYILATIMNNSIEIVPNFNAKCALYSTIHAGKIGSIIGMNINIMVSEVLYL